MFSNREGLLAFLIKLGHRIVTDAFLTLDAGLVTVTLSYVACAALICFAERRVTLRYRDVPNRLSLVVLVSALLSYALFYAGYFGIFGNSFASFFRYSSTILGSALLYVTLRFLAVRTDARTASVRTPSRGTLLRSVLVSLACLALCAAFLLRRREKKYDGQIYDAAEIHAAVLREAIDRDREAGGTEPTSFSDVYLLNASQAENDFLLHHRVYYLLIGSELRIRNFYNETALAPIGTIDIDDPAAVDAVTKSFCARLAQERFQYVYIVYPDDLMRAVFAALSGSDAVERGVYRIEPADTLYGITLTRLS